MFRKAIFCALASAAMIPAAALAQHGREARLSGRPLRKHASYQFVSAVKAHMFLRLPKG